MYTIYMVNIAIYKDILNCSLQYDTTILNIFNYICSNNRNRTKTSLVL